MKIAVTGGSGGVGRAITDEALSLGHSVVSIDRVVPDNRDEREGLRFVEADAGNFEKLSSAFDGCDALIHMAAIPAPGKDPNHVIHNNNVVSSYNALQAAAEHGIMRICQASSVNAIGLSFSRAPQHDYFPIDEQHPNYSEEPYSLSKWICEQQGDCFARRYDDIRIASMRFHWVVADRATAGANFNRETGEEATHLWGYTRFDSAARACVMSLNADFKGHEVFYIMGPESTNDIASLDLAKKYFPNVPVTGDLSGNRSFFSTEKAERMLGWKHNI